MAERVELQWRRHASKKPIGMNVHQRLMHLPAAAAFPGDQSGPPGIWPVFLRFNGMRCSSPGLRRYEPAESAVAFARVSLGEFFGLPPNNRVNRTAQQRRCARCWVPFALRAPAAGYAER
jgi:hypothetical protein